MFYTRLKQTDREKNRETDRQTERLTEGVMIAADTRLIPTRNCPIFHIRFRQRDRQTDRETYRRSDNSCRYKADSHKKLSHVLY